MKDLVAQVSAIAASNASQAALRHCCSQQAVASIPAVKELLSSPGEFSILSPASKKNLVLNDINELLPSAAELALQASLRFAEAHIRSCAAASFSFLASPDWTAAVSGTGAALAAQRATAKCTQILISEVRSHSPSPGIREATHGKKGSFFSFFFFPSFLVRNC